MANIPMKYITDKDGNKVLPITNTAAVRDDQGNNIGTLLGAEASARQNADSGLQTSINNEIIRAQAAEETLRQAYRALTESDVVVVAPSDTWPVASPAANTIYRVVDRTNTPSQNYSDYMWDGSGSTLADFVLMATYNNAIDQEPIAGSTNLVESGGVAKYYNTYNITKLVPLESGVYTFATARTAASTIIKGNARPGCIIEFATERNIYNRFTKYESYRYISSSTSDGAFGLDDNWEKSDLYKDTIITRKTVDLRKLAPLSSGFYTLETAIEAVISNGFAIGEERNGLIISFTTTKDIYNIERVEQWMFTNYTGTSDGAFRHLDSWVKLPMYQGEFFKVYDLDDLAPLSEGTFYNISTAITALQSLVPATNRYGVIVEFKVDRGYAYRDKEVWIYCGNSESDGAFSSLNSWRCLYSSGKPTFCLNPEIDSFVQELYIPVKPENEVRVNTMPFIRGISRNDNGTWAINIKDSNNILLFKSITVSPEPNNSIIKLEPYGHLSNNFSEGYILVNWDKMQDNHNYLQNDSILTRNAYDLSKSPRIMTMLNTRKQNPLYGKIVSCLGDSYTGGFSNNWVYDIAGRCGCQMLNYGSFGSTVLPMDCILTINTSDYTKASDMVSVGDVYKCTDLYSGQEATFSISAASSDNLRITIDITSGVLRNMYDNAAQNVVATKVSGAASSVSSFIMGQPNQIECFGDRAERISNTSDVIVIFGGVNDALMIHQGRETIGTLDGMETGSFYKNYNDLLTQIITQFPSKTIITVAPPHIQSGASAYSPYIGGVSKAVKEISAKYGIPCADLYNNCTGFSNLAAQNSIVYPSSDNVHPNSYGQNLMSIVIENVIKKNLVTEYFK